MTRMNDVPDPNPGRVLGATLAQGILLWEKGLSDATRAVWTHKRDWNRTHWSPLGIIAFVAAKVALEFYKEPIPESETKWASDTVHAHARDYLYKLFYIGGMGFSYNVEQLAVELAHNFSPCITLNANISGGWWYVIGTEEAVRQELLELKEDPVLARFVERFTELYPEVSELLRWASAPGVLFSNLVQELSEDFSSEWEKRREKIS